jgi:hypothetical protein
LRRGGNCICDRPCDTKSAIRVTSFAHSHWLDSDSITCTLSSTVSCASRSSYYYRVRACICAYVLCAVYVHLRGYESSSVLMGAVTRKADCSRSAGQAAMVCSVLSAFGSSAGEELSAGGGDELSNRRGGAICATEAVCIGTVCAHRSPTWPVKY